MRTAAPNDFVAGRVDREEIWIRCFTSVSSTAKCSARSGHRSRGGKSSKPLGVRVLEQTWSSPLESSTATPQRGPGLPKGRELCIGAVLLTFDTPSRDDLTRGVELGDQVVAGVGDVDVAFAGGGAVDGEVGRGDELARSGPGGAGLAFFAFPANVAFGFGGAVLVDVTAEGEEEFTVFVEFLDGGRRRAVVTSQVPAVGPEVLSVICSTSGRPGCP